MIKLIASDVDGTLLHEGGSDLNPYLFEIIRKLKAHGIRFAVASGRQYESIRKVFLPVLNDIFVIADNGGYIYEKDQLLTSNLMGPEEWHKIREYLKTVPDTYIMLSSLEGTYTDCRHQEFLDLLEHGYGVKMTFVDDLTELDIKISKVAVYTSFGDPMKMAEESRKLFGKEVNVFASGSKWMDFISVNSNKACGLKWLQNHLGVLPEQTMAFGDNNNDVEMLRCASESYAVAGAKEEAKQAAKYVMQEGVADDGVVHVLERFLEQMEK